MLKSDSLVFLQRGFVVPVGAFDLALKCEADGIRLSIGPGDKLVADTLSGDPLPVEVLQSLRRHKAHVLAILRYTPSDNHLFDASVAFPNHGPIDVRRSA